MWIYCLGSQYDAKDAGVLNKKKQIPTRTFVSLCGIAIAWAVLWTVRHFQRPASFPWIGILAGTLFVAPLFANDWIALHKQRDKAKRERLDRIDWGRF